MGPGLIVTLITVFVKLLIRESQSQKIYYIETVQAIKFIITFLTSNLLFHHPAYADECNFPTLAEEVTILIIKKNFKPCNQIKMGMY